MTGPLDLISFAKPPMKALNEGKIATREEGELRAVHSFFRASPFSRVVSGQGKWQNTRSQIVEAIFVPDFFTQKKNKALYM